MYYKNMLPVFNSVQQNFVQYWQTNKIFQYCLTMVRQKYFFVTGTKKIQFAPILPISILDVDDDEE